MTNRLCTLLGIDRPIISGGMVWCSGWRLAAAVSNSGGLGLIGAGSMTPDLLREHIRKCKAATTNPFGVNVPLMYYLAEEIMQVILDEYVPVVVTSAGSPKKYTARLKEQGIKVLHVVSSSKFAIKSQEAGVDAVIAEGFEAGGHNGREETTTMSLIPSVAQSIDVPLVAAGGIASGEAILAAQALGADGVQIGTLFALSEESSAHRAFKEYCIKSQEGDTMLSLKALSPTRLLRNEFFHSVTELEARAASVEEFTALLGRGRSRMGIFEGDLVEGELEIGQVASQIDSIHPVAEIMDRLMEQYRSRLERIMSNR